MNTNVVVGIGLAVLAVVGMIGYKLYDSASLESITDSANVRETVNIGVDNWAGYFVLCSKETRRIALDDGILIKCHDDKANYPERMAKLASGDLQMAAATVDGYIMAGADVKYPGHIMFVIDESQGGDAIIANSQVAKNTDDLKNKKGLKIAYTPDSPSQTLVTAWKNHFDVPIDKPDHFTVVPANGSSDALKKLLSGEVDVAVLWEPDVSKALENPNFVKMLGTESTKNLIVDVLIGNQRFVQNNPETAQTVVSAYFQALEFYKNNPTEFSSALAKYAGVKDEQVAKLKDGINWIDLAHNSVDWLGIRYGNVKVRRQLYDTITSSIRLLQNNGDLTDNPLPGQDPFRIINSNAITTFVADVQQGKYGAIFRPATSVVDTSVTRTFAKLSPGRWAKLKEVGSLKVEPISFRRGTSDLDPTKQPSFSKLVEMLTTYPHYRIKVVGHTGRRGDKAANMNLSKQRALAAARFLESEYGIDKYRIYAFGVGNTRPPIRATGEKKRAYYARWPRVELILVGE